MPIKKFRSLDDIRKALRVEPGTLEHSYALRSVFLDGRPVRPKTATSSRGLQISFH